MDSKEATKRPWRFKDAPNADCQGQRYGVFGPPHPVDGGDYAALFRTSKRADAELVVCAVNSHDELVKVADAGHELATLAETIHEGADKSADTWIGELLRRVDSYRDAYVAAIAKASRTE